MDYTDKMLNDIIKDFKEKISQINKRYSIFPNGNIFDNNTEELIMIKNIEKIIDIETSILLEEKLNIKYIIEKLNIREYKSGADKILEDEKKTYGFKLIISVDNIIFHESSYSTDDYKYDTDPEKSKIKIINNIEIIKNSYYKLIMYIFIQLLKNKKIYNKQTKINPTIYKKDVVVYGGKK